jgi:energy-coupling factor transporter transmembrane protein EcfT
MKKLIFIFIFKLVIAVSLLVFFIFIRLLLKIPFRRIKNLTLLALFIILMQIIFYPGESYIINPLFPHWFPFIGGAGSLKWEGLMFGITIACRLAALMVLLPVFTETTPPNKIASGLCALGFNYHIAFIITTAFNLIFFFRDEALVIMDAQRLRGMRSNGIRAYTGLLVPLMLCAMRKAQVSSVAMDSRAFRIYKTRTWLDKPKLKKCDFLFMAFCVIFMAFHLILNYYLKATSQ